MACTMHVAWRQEPTRRAVTLLKDGGERTIVTIGERLNPHGSDDLEWELLHSTDGVYFTAGDGGALQHGRDARESSRRHGRAMRWSTMAAR